MLANHSAMKTQLKTLCSFLFITHTLGAICVGDECPEGYQVEEEDNEYAAAYLDSCRNDAQCEWLGANSSCKNNVCSCKAGHKWYKGKCKEIVLLGQTCSSDDDCFNGYDHHLGYECINNSDNTKQCGCKEGYYIRETECRKKSEEGKSCALDLDCNSEKGKEKCVLGKCVVPKLEAELKPNTSPPLPELTEMKYITRWASDISEGCKAPNTMEFHSKCVCQQGYFSLTNFTDCTPEIGVQFSCKNDSDCSIRFSHCAADGACYCRDYWYPSENKRECVKSITQTNPNCLSKEWCYTWGNSTYCNAEGVCNCTSFSKFVEETQYCQEFEPPPKDYCSDFFDCSIKNQLCQDGSCQCPDKYDYVTKNNTTICAPSEAGAKCDEDNTCDEVGNSTCVGGYCSCLESHVDIDGICYERKSLNSPCQFDVQCTSLAVCDNKTHLCTCMDGSYPIEDHCYEDKRLKYCTNAIDCTVIFGNKWECRRSTCQCIESLKLVGLDCVSSSSKFGYFGGLLLMVVLKSVYSF